MMHCFEILFECSHCLILQPTEGLICLEEDRTLMALVKCSILTYFSSSNYFTKIGLEGLKTPESGL